MGSGWRAYSCDWFERCAVHSLEHAVHLLECETLAGMCSALAVRCSTLSGKWDALDATVGDYTTQQRCLNAHQ